MFLDQHLEPLSWRKRLITTFWIVLCYVLLGHVDILFAGYLSSQSFMAGQSGLALAMVLILGLQNALPGILIGTIILAFENWSFSPGVIGDVSANLIEVILGSMLLKGFNSGKFKFKSPKDIFTFVSISAFLAPFVSTTAAIVFLYWSNLLPHGWIASLWTVKFLGKFLGIVIITPLIISLYSEDSKRIRSWEGVLLYTCLFAVCSYLFGEEGFKVFFFIPFFTWIALRFSFRGVSIAAFMVGHIAAWKSMNVGLVFSSVSVASDRLIIQMVMSGVAVIGYLLATVVEAQETAQEKEIELNIKEDALAILDQSLHKSPIAFGLIGKDMKYIRVNEALAKLNGVDANAHLGRSVSEIVPMSSDEFEPFFLDVLRTGKSYMNMPYSGHPPHDPSGFIAGLISYYPVRHPASHEIFAVAFSFQDITEQQMIHSLLKENQERLRFAQEAGKIGAFEWDMVTREIVWTAEMEYIYGLNTGEFEGTYESWFQWIHPEDVEKIRKEIYKSIHSEDEIDVQFRIKTSSEEIRWVLGRGRVITDPQGRKKLIGINIDITKQKTTEHKLRLTEANLLHALSVRDEFMAIASHELKTPLTSLKLQNQLLQRNLNKQEVYTPEKLKTFIEKNCVQIDRLTRLVDDMLDISRLRTGKFSLKKESCEISGMLRDILARTREQFAASGSGEPIIEQLDLVSGEWDPLRIDQVLTNIVTNAIRYGQGKPVRISVMRLEKTVRISVKDQGLGIPKSDQEKIFKRYERGLLSREVSGLGLGLFISKQIVEAHGGNIWVESTLNQGSTFFVDLPCTTASIETDNSSVESPSDQKQTEASEASYQY
jgi:PAS domain S-box-containing protein